MNNKLNISGDNWLNHLEGIFLVITIVVVFVVSVLDFAGVLDQFPWLADRVSTLTLLLLGSVTGYIVFERRSYVKNLNILSQTISSSTVLKPLGLRQDLGEIYKEYFNSATKKIDVIALTSEGLVSGYGEQLLKQKLLNEQCDIRILILNPKSPLWEYRINDEKATKRTRIEEVSESNKAFFNQLKNQIDLSKCKGSLTVKFHNRIPYFAYFRADEKMIFGLYYSYTFGVRSHAIDIVYESDIFEALVRHFDAIWYGSETEDVVQISYFGPSLSGEDN